MQDSLNKHFLLRKFHSLTGLLPVGVFLFFHLWENSLSRRDHIDEYGAGYYNEHVVHFINSINYIRLIEVLLLGSILYHAVYGLVIWWQGKSNVTKYNYLHNWGYWLQRTTALITFAFIAYHVLTTRFAGDAVTADLYGHMVKTLANPLNMVVYLVGLVAASFHLCYGLWLLSITWGVATHPRGQRIVFLVSMALFVVATAIGIHGLWGFNEAFFV